MAAHLIPIDRLSNDALRGVIEEFISREGTDYGEREVSRETSFNQLKHRLEKGLAVLVFDEDTETTNIFPADSPTVRKIKAQTEE
jgi:uncharacterized protein